jgi:hypothetical protein
VNRLEEELIRGVLGASEVRERLGVSPATLMRLARSSGPGLMRIGRGRASRYVLRQVWAGLDDSRFPVFRVTEQGTAVPAGELITLAAHQSIWTPDSISNGLPSELADARPSGFLGRHFAALHADLRLPARLSDWSDHHVLIAMSRRGEDLPGDLIVGEESFARWQVLENRAVTRDRYPAIATATIAGHPPGSSAGGERPKFGVLANGRHRLVKFAARGAATDVVARRWCDLLILEDIALDAIRSRGTAAPTTAVVEAPTHWFLESERFDRVGERGRRAVLSLAAIHDDAADSWSRAAVTLRRAGRVTEEDARRLRWLDAFGALIGNTDRHQYNIVFFTDGDRLTLAPAFDQVSMLYAPTADGQLPPRTFARPLVTSDTLDVWEDAREAASLFWGRGADDPRVSDDMRAICADNARALRQ